MDDERFPPAAGIVDPREQFAIGTEMAGRRGIDLEEHRAQVALLEGRPWSRRPPGTTY